MRFFSSFASLIPSPRRWGQIWEPDCSLLVGTSAPKVTFGIVNKEFSNKKIRGIRGTTLLHAKRRRIPKRHDQFRDSGVPLCLTDEPQRSSSVIPLSLDVGAAEHMLTANAKTTSCLAKGKKRDVC